MRANAKATTATIPAGTGNGNGNGPTLFQVDQPSAPSSATTVAELAGPVGSFQENDAGEFASILNGEHDGPAEVPPASSYPPEAVEDFLVCIIRPVFGDGGTVAQIGDERLGYVDRDGDVFLVNIQDSEVRYTWLEPEDYERVGKEEAAAPVEVVEVAEATEPIETAVAPPVPDDPPAPCPDLPPAPPVPAVDPTESYQLKLAAWRAHIDAIEERVKTCSCRILRLSTELKSMQSRYKALGDVLSELDGQKPVPPSILQKPQRQQEGVQADAESTNQTAPVPAETHPQPSPATTTAEIAGQVLLAPDPLPVPDVPAVEAGDGLVSSPVSAEEGQEPWRLVKLADLPGLTPKIVEILEGERIITLADWVRWPGQHPGLEYTQIRNSAGSITEARFERLMEAVTKATTRG